MNYTTPTPQQFKAWLKRYRITGNLAAAWSGLGGSHQVRKYTGGANPRRVGYPLAFAIAAGSLFGDRDGGPFVDVAAHANAAHEADPATPWATWFALHAWGGYMGADDIDAVDARVETLFDEEAS